MAKKLFSQTLKRLRTERGISQAQLAEMLFTDRSTITRWENGSRIPNNMMITRISKLFGTDISILLNSTTEIDEAFNIILVDDNRIFIRGSIPIVAEVMPNATITGFNHPSEAIEYAKANPVTLALVDIELGNASGFELCRTLLDINPRTNVVFLTAYVDYAFDAWSTGACGFMHKPLTPEGLREQLKKLRYSIRLEGMDE